MVAYIYDNKIIKDTKSHIIGPGSVDITGKAGAPLPEKYNIPDYEGHIDIDVYANNTRFSCFTANLRSSTSMKQDGVKYTAVAISCAALLVCGVGALLPLKSPLVSATMFWTLFELIQFIVFSAMHSLDFPSIYLSFAANFGWSTGLIGNWGGIQSAIDDFRNGTIYPGKNFGVDTMNGNETVAYAVAASTTNKTAVKSDVTSSGIQVFASMLNITDSNILLTFIISFALLLSLVLILLVLFRVIILGAGLRWLKGRYHTRLASLRDHYLTTAASVLLLTAFIFYPTWTMFSLYEFRIGGSWGICLVGGVGFGLSSLVLVMFTASAMYLAYKYQGNLEEIYKKPIVSLHGAIYKELKISCWWWWCVSAILVPFVHVSLIALTDNGLAQTICCLVIQLAVAATFVYFRPFASCSRNLIGTFIESLKLCVYTLMITFARQIDLSLFTKTIIGLVIIGIESFLIIFVFLLMVFGAIEQVRSCLSHVQSLHDSGEHGVSVEGLGIHDMDHDISPPSTVTQVRPPVVLPQVQRFTFPPPPRAQPTRVYTPPAAKAVLTRVENIASGKRKNEDLCSSRICEDNDTYSEKWTNSRSSSRYDEMPFQSGQLYRETFTDKYTRLNGIWSDYLRPTSMPYSVSSRSLVAPLRLSGVSSNYDYGDVYSYEEDDN